MLGSSMRAERRMAGMPPPHTMRVPCANVSCLSHAHVSGSTYMRLMCAGSDLDGRGAAYPDTTLCQTLFQNEAELSIRSVVRMSDVGSARSQ